MEVNRSSLNNLSSVVGKYIGMRTDDFKTNVISGLSVGFARFLSVLLLLMLLMIVMAVFAIGFIMLLGEAIGSWSGAAFIVGGVYLIAFTVLFFIRKRLFVNMFANLFSGILDTGNPADSWKALVLTMVRYLRRQLVSD